MAPQKLPLSGKVAIVTGASRGIGEAIALELGKRGASVAITYTSESSAAGAENVAKKIESLNNGAKTTTIRGNLTSPTTPAAIVAHVTTTLGPKVDILVNNAGVESTKTLDTLTLEEWDSVMALNLRAPWLMTVAVLPHLRAPGRIINIGSVVSRSNYPGMGAYMTSKAGLEGFTRTLAAELGPQGHTVNTVLPGPTEGEMVQRAPQDMIATMKANTPLQNRLATKEDVAEVIALLAEERARWITGQSISASGGFLMI
ncbi:hypothetical protein BDY21DRAFT_349087 [Lineolata rhizophorae]|uniref:3-oxoacyl-[acyl-carrier-protein] reductase n=1 Tax=Lineolata rhizophorae TaxID=578093 RepID=A0A6A6NWT2_9PEZI|nr:hypothetical protein BDY21DRAFT_349087 [Lineolata rhizophorae]